jgi:hypothetical protein
VIRRKIESSSGIAKFQLPIASFVESAIGIGNRQQTYGLERFTLYDAGRKIRRDDAEQFET